jgi:hypothetical protein
MIVRKFALVGGVGVLLGVIPCARANPVTFTGSSGSLAASAKFEVVSGNLQVTLTNTSSADVLVPSDVLTAVFFDVNGVGALTRVSAVLGGGSSVFYDPDGQPAGGVVGGEWAYRSGISAFGATEGISSTGINIFGPGDRFPGADLAPPASPDGLQYGILSAGDNTATGNGGVTGSGGLIKNQVVFTLSGLPTGFDPSATGKITHVSFLYGTAIDEPHYDGHTNPVPLPAAASMGIGLLGSLGGAKLLRRRRESI